MALLMLRTHDLSWQDHVVNIEFMVNPSHNQLLLNKHKTLASKCDKIKKSFDSELKTKQKDFVLNIRMMERKKRALQKRKSEIDSGKGSRKSSLSGNIASKYRSGNNNIPKTNVKRGQSAPPNIDSTFLTEIEIPVRNGDDSLSTPSPGPPLKTIHAWYNGTPNNSAQPTHRPTTYSSLRSFSRQKFVRFDENSEVDLEPSKEIDLREKVKLFLDAQKSFNQRPLTYIGRYKEIIERIPVERSTLSAKKYETTKLDTDALVNVFDDLCQNRSLDNFKKLSILATRVKTNFKLARNTSVIPAVGSLKAARRFKEIVEGSNIRD